MGFMPQRTIFQNESDVKTVSVYRKTKNGPELQLCWAVLYQTVKCVGYDSRKGQSGVEGEGRRVRNGQREK